MARDSSGIPWTYSGTGTGLFGWRIKADKDWNIMSAISQARGASAVPDGCGLSNKHVGQCATLEIPGNTPTSEA